MGLPTSDRAVIPCSGDDFSLIYGLPGCDVESTPGSLIVSLPPKLWAMRAWIAPTQWGDRRIEYRLKEAAAC